MSVLKSKREMSKCNFLKSLRELEVLTIQRTNRKQEYHETFLKEMIRYSMNAYNYASSAYSMTIQTKTDIYLQHKFFKLAFANISAFNVQLSIYYDLYKNSPKGLSPKEMVNFSNLIDQSATDLHNAIMHYKEINKKIIFD